MPLIYRLLGYGGNGVLLLFGIIGVLSADGFWPGVFMGGLGGLNLYLIRKIDLYSREEVWLEAEVRKRELRHRIEALDEEEAASQAAGEPKRIPHAKDDEPQR